MYSPQENLCSPALSEAQCGNAAGPVSDCRIPLRPTRAPSPRPSSCMMLDTQRSGARRRTDRQPGDRRRPQGARRGARRARARAAHRRGPAPEIGAHRRPGRAPRTCCSRTATGGAAPSGSAGMQDEIIRILFEFAAGELYPLQVRSQAERMAVVATGGYGRGLLAPGSDIDLLFLLPYKQTAWGELVAEVLLYCLWDMGLKVGHATRSVNECIRQAKADMTIRTALLELRLSVRRRQALRRAHRAVRQGGRAGDGAGIRRRQARRARGASPPRRPVALSRRAQRQGRQGRPARPAHAVLDRQIRLPRARAGGADRRGVFDRDEYSLFRRCEDFLWSVRCNMHFLAGRAEERLSFDIQREIAVRLGYTEHPGSRTSSAS